MQQECALLRCLAALREFFFDGFLEGVDVEVDLYFFLFPLGIFDWGAVVVDAVSFCAQFFEEAPVEVKRGMLFAQIGKKALMIGAFYAVETKEGVRELVESVVMQRVDHGPLDGFLSRDRDEFLRLSAHRTSDVDHHLYLVRFR